MPPKIGESNEKEHGMGPSEMEAKNREMEPGVIWGLCRDLNGLRRGLWQPNPNNEKLVGITWRGRFLRLKP